MWCHQRSKQVSKIFIQFYGTPPLSSCTSSLPTTIRSSCALGSNGPFPQLSTRSHSRQSTAASKSRLDNSRPSASPNAANGHSQKGLPWQLQVNALKRKFPSGWQPRKRLSPDAVEGIQALHARDPHRNSTPVLAEHFEVSPEVIRRILKSKWKPSEEEQDLRRQRWERRGQRIWSDMAEKGIKPPRRWQTARRLETEEDIPWSDSTAGQDQRSKRKQDEADDLVPFTDDKL